LRLEFFFSQRLCVRVGFLAKAQRKEKHKARRLCFERVDVTNPGPKMPESLKTRFLRWRFNFFPAYRGTGARLTYIADDFHEIRTKLPLNWRTRNYVGTTFGGSLYGAVDPLYMVMLIKILGKG
jgi:hypothetical protein